MNYLNYLYTNCNKLYQSAWTTNESISISSSVWMSIVSGANDGKLFWAVATRQNDNPTTGPYYSGFRECLLSDNVTTMENVFRSLRCSFTDGVSELWFKVSITEDAYYSIFSTGNIDVEGSIYVLGSDNILTKLGNNPPTYYTKTDNNFDIARELTSGTTYYIRVQANDNTAGSCVLNIRTHISISSFDIEHQGYFDEEGYVMYRMRLTSGRYAIYTTGSTDTYIQVQDTPVTCWSDFNDAILYDDDSGRDTNACVIISCTSIQYIYIIVKGYSETTYGDFGLVVVPTQNVTSLDTSYRNSLEEAELDWYSFTAAQSGTYAFYASGAIDTYADLFDFYEPNGGIDYVVTSNDDGDSLYNTSINFCILYEMDAGETVYIRARAFDNTTTGDYNFYVSKYQ